MIFNLYTPAEVDYGQNRFRLQVFQSNPKKISNENFKILIF